MKRMRMSGKQSRRSFRKSSGVHPKNRAVVMRGGIRL